MDEKVIRVREEVVPRRRGWIWFDWRNFLIVGGLSAMAALGKLLGPQ